MSMALLTRDLLSIFLAIIMLIHHVSQNVQEIHNHWVLINLSSQDQFKFFESSASSDVLEGKSPPVCFFDYIANLKIAFFRNGSKKKYHQIYIPESILMSNISKGND